MKEVIAEVVDDGEFFEVNPFWAMNIVCGFARVDGHVVGIVGNQPAVLAGTLDIDASEKAARFVRTCDAFNVPLVTFVDVPGFLPGHRPGVRRHHPSRRQAALRLLRGDRPPGADHHPQGLRRRLRGHELEVDRRRPRLRVAVGRDRGDGCDRRGEHHLPQGDRRAADDVEAKRAELIAEYTERFANPYIAAERGYVDDVIDPRETRQGARRVAGHAAHQARAAAVAQARERAAVIGDSAPACDLARRDARGGRGDRRGAGVARTRPRDRRSAPTTRCTSGCARRVLRSHRSGLQRGPWRLSGRVGRRIRA